MKRKTFSKDWKFEHLVVYQCLYSGYILAHFSYRWCSFHLKRNYLINPFLNSRPLITFLCTKKYELLIHLSHITKTSWKRQKLPASKDVLIDFIMLMDYFHVSLKDFFHLIIWAAYMPVKNIKTIDEQLGEQRMMQQYSKVNE